MPNIIIHEKVGNDISKRIHINSYDYYLGLLAPDAPNLHGFASKEERWIAHQRREDYDDWRDSLYLFYQREKNHYPIDFLIGYYVHVLTDIIFDDLFYLDVREKILKDYSLDEAHNVMREDMNSYSFSEVNEIKKILEQDDKSYDILNISKEQLLLWKNKQVEAFNDRFNCRYISDDLIHHLVKQVLKELLSRIEL